MQTNNFSVEGVEHSHKFGWWVVVLIIMTSARDHLFDTY